MLVVVGGAVETLGVLEGNGVCCREADAIPVCVMVSEAVPLTVVLGAEVGDVLDMEVMVVLVGNGCEVEPEVDAVVVFEEPDVEGEEVVRGGLTETNI